MSAFDVLHPNVIRSYMTHAEYLYFKPKPEWNDYERRWIKPRVRVPMARKVVECHS